MLYCCNEQVVAAVAPTSTAAVTATSTAGTGAAAASATTAITTVRDAAAEARATLESMPHHSIDTVQVLHNTTVYAAQLKVVATARLCVGT
jgi:hypothetical protein